MDQAIHNLWLWLFDGNTDKAALHNDKFQGILDAYSEPQRFYHTKEHLVDFAVKIEALGLKGSFQNLKKVAAFIVYHDVIYRTDSRENIVQNEELSALRAEREMTEMGIDTQTIKETVSLIRATKTHQIDPLEDPEGALLIDLDMSILASDWEVYDRYAQNIRREYAMFEGLAFDMRRKNGFIERTLNGSEPIFKTKLFYDLFEEKAHQNLRRELRAINARLENSPGFTPGLN